MSALVAPLSGHVHSLEMLHDTRYLKRWCVRVRLVAPWYARSALVMPATGHIQRVIETPYPIPDLDHPAKSYRTAIDLELRVQAKPERVMLVVSSRYLDRAIPLSCVRGERVLVGRLFARVAFGVVVDLYLPIAIGGVLAEKGMRVRAGETRFL